MTEVLLCFRYSLSWIPKGIHVRDNVRRLVLSIVMLKQWDFGEEGHDGKSLGPKGNCPKKGLR